MRFHDLRHTAATNMHQLTGDFFSVGEILGHTLKGIGISLGISTNLEAVVPLKVDEKNETWVSVWGVETTTKNGKTDSMKLHETWRLNNAGKIYHVQQYSAKPPITDTL